MKVNDIRIRQIFATNSRKTIEIELATTKGKVKASVPMGTSRSKYEAVYLLPEEVLENFSKIKRHFISESFSDQADLDEFLRILDKTEEFKDIGGNLALAISSAFLKAFALEEGKEVFEFLSKKSTIPIPLCNVAGGWKGQSDMQEFLFLPFRQKSFFSTIENISSAYLQLGKKLKEKDASFNFGKNIESGWVTSLKSRKLLDALTEVADENSLAMGLDVAASELWDGKKYVYKDEVVTTSGQITMMEQMAKDYPIIYIEDPFHEDDFVSFSTLTSRLSNKLVVGDDLFSTNFGKLQYGISYKAAKGIIVKPSQVGTITDVIKVVKEAKKNEMKTILSHRSGETDDAFISHLAVGLNCDYIKLGISGERVVKINEIIRIEEKIKH